MMETLLPGAWIRSTSRRAPRWRGSSRCRWTPRRSTRFRGCGLMSRFPSRWRPLLEAALDVASHHRHVAALRLDLADESAGCPRLDGLGLLRQRDGPVHDLLVLAG